MQACEHNYGPSFNLDLLVGLRHKDTHVIQAHGAFIAAQGQGQGQGQIKTCLLFDSAQFVSCCSMSELVDQVQLLLERRWVWMTKHDVEIACFGMRVPRADQPFWNPGCQQECAPVLDGMT